MPDSRRLLYEQLWAPTPDGPRLLAICPDAPAPLRVFAAAPGRPERPRPTNRHAGGRCLDPLYLEHRRTLPRYLPSDLRRDAPQLAAALPHGQPRGDVDWADVYSLFPRLIAAAARSAGFPPRAPVELRAMDRYALEIALRTPEEAA